MYSVNYRLTVSFANPLFYSTSPVVNLTNNLNKASIKYLNGY
jgi:hypothetical protein